MLKATFTLTITGNNPSEFSEKLGRFKGALLNEFPKAELTPFTFGSIVAGVPYNIVVCKGASKLDAKTSDGATLVLDILDDGTFRVFKDRSGTEEGRRHPLQYLYEYSLHRMGMSHDAIGEQVATPSTDKPGKPVPHLSPEELTLRLKELEAKVDRLLDIIESQRRNLERFQRNTEQELQQFNRE